MEAQFTYAPMAGQYEEVSFDFVGDWKGQAWAWVQFCPTQLPTWFGCFRGQAGQCFTASMINRVAVLTSDCLYLVNPDNRAVVYFPDPHYEDLIVSAQQDLVVALAYACFLLFNEQGQIAEIAVPAGIDLVRFEQAEGALIRFTCEEILDRQKREGILDLVSLTVRL